MNINFGTLDNVITLFIKSIGSFDIYRPKSSVVLSGCLFCYGVSPVMHRLDEKYLEMLKHIQLRFYGGWWVDFHHPLATVIPTLLILDVFWIFPLVIFSSSKKRLDGNATTCRSDHRIVKIRMVGRIINLRRFFSFGPSFWWLKLIIALFQIKSLCKLHRLRVM